MSANPYAWRTTPKEEWRTIQVAAARAGCVVRSLDVRMTAFGPRVVGEVDCPDGWGAARMLLAAAYEDARSPGARDLALSLRREAPTDAEYARAVHRFIKDRVKFVREHGEVFSSAGYTLAAGAGDCDDHARAAIALALAGGIGAQLGILHRGADAPPEERGPAHAAAVLCVDGRCNWAETTVDAAFGEHPLTAAGRLGLLRSRADLAKESRIMSEKDLAPLPPHFVLKNPPAQVALDADALVKLGYLAALPADPADPTSMDFRQALLAFQMSAGITTDGLIGPESRAAIGARLPQDHFQAEYQQSIGATSDDPVSASGAGDLSDGFFGAVAQMARDFQAKGAKVNGLDFLAVWMGESGVNPHRKGNPPFGDETGPHSFGGLNMMSEQARHAAGFPGTLSEFVGLSDVEQLVFVRRYYESRDLKKLTSRTALELMNFLPAYVSHADDPSFVLARKGDGTKIWESNRFAFDPTGRGYIMVEDLTKWTIKNAQGPRWNALASRMSKAGDPPAGGLGPAGVASLLLLVVGVAGAVANMTGKL